MKLLLIEVIFLTFSTFCHGHLPTVDLSDKSFQTSNLLDDGGKFGAFIVKNLGQDYSNSVEALSKNAQNCLKEYPLLPRLDMNDASIRTTFASTQKESPECLSSEISTIVEAFDKIDTFVTNFIEMEVGKIEYFIGERKDSKALKNSPIKEHLHLYEKNVSSSVKSSKMVPFHIDNGLYLIITPFMNHGLQIQTSSGKVYDSSKMVKNDEALVLIGRGLTDWLLQGDSKNRGNFYAVPHAVESMSENLDTRTVFARMKLVPLDAVVKGQNLEFFNVFHNLDESDSDDRLCSKSVEDSPQGRPHMLSLMT